MPGFEELPDDIESFFKTGGEVPDSLKGEITPPVEEPAPNTGAPSGAADAPVESDAVPQDGVITAAPTKTEPVSSPNTPAVDYSAQLAAQQAKLDQLTKFLADQQAAEKARLAEANKPVAPDPKEDPLGFLTFQIKQVEAQIQAQNAQNAERANQDAQDKVMSLIKSQVAAFEEKNTDYSDAYKYLVDLRTADYKIRGLSDEQIMFKIGGEEREILQQAISQGKNPAELVYSMAQRYGYVKKDAPKEVPKQDVGATLDKIKAGIETASAERGAPPPTYSTEAVKGMSKGQFADAVENHWEEMFGKSKSGSIFD